MKLQIVLGISAALLVSGQLHHDLQPGDWQRAVERASSPMLAYRGEYGHAAEIRLPMRHDEMESPTEQGRDDAITRESKIDAAEVREEAERVRDESMSRLHR
eukprot:gnl/MRDRNA2_/MRDRNA2_98339_c0_seq1.p1 gnl/MRDRNA2_/MRDRNA2_98339_c0~~gnl/MRDRNA2_/MRDRNA2_98339_c0_seq1.p1  ORF type:complete len:102 (-),score=27.50 gnl/MRDRNA2_/MRDRNA2_98339_c0_seq1:39-344(-)